MDSRPESTSWHRTAPRRPTEWLVLLALLGALAWIGFTAYHRYRERQARRHPEAMARWLEWARNDFRRASPTEIKETFHDCFRKGDVASDYADLFATGSKSTTPAMGTGTGYSWCPGGSEEGDYIFEVVVSGNPPVIDGAYALEIGH
jgi:hypothetical protein